MCEMNACFGLIEIKFSGNSKFETKAYANWKVNCGVNCCVEFNQPPANFVR